MSIVKVVTPDSLNYDEPVVSEVKLTGRGLTGSDRDAFVKRASDDLLRDIDRIREKVASDEVLVHMLAMGATEFYGPNRNGDGFRASVCREYHPTFEKFARFYRNHQNKDPKKSYGRVVKSAWHDPMKRIELLVALNANEAAARRNGGLIADREMEKLAANKEIAVSMACSVPHDVCSYCANVAPTTADYCSGTYQGGMCKAGGLRDNIGSLIEIDGGIHHLHADNPQPSFFDISNVYRPADRIAYVMGALEKSAAVHGRVIKSAELAHQMGIVEPIEMMLQGDYPKEVEHLIKTAYLLAARESQIHEDPNTLSATSALAFRDSVQDADLELPPQFRYKFAYALRAMADQQICLPVSAFLAATTDISHEKAATVSALVSRELPGIFTRMLEKGDLPARVKKSHYAPSVAVAPPRFETWAAKLASHFSLHPAHVQDRVTRAALYLEEAPVLRSGNEKVASDNSDVSKLAEEYALYQLSFLGAQPTHKPDLALTADLVLLQNYAA